MKSSEYRECEDCEFADFDKALAGECQLDGTVQLKNFGCVPNEVLFTVQFAEMDDEDKRTVLDKLGLEAEQGLAPTACGVRPDRSATCVNRKP